VDPRIQRVLAIIEADPHQKLSLFSLARRAGLSSSRLRHKFKSEVGITPTAYVQNVRLKLGEELLKHNGLSVKEVRAAIGFESDSYFTHLCERVYGVPPSRIRNPSSFLASRTRTRL
jgi:transcriptional regulator GlxA family with amidase domain